MGDRLALARVARLSPRELYRYLAPMLDRHPGSVSTDAYLRAILRELAGDAGRPPFLRLAAADVETIQTLLERGDAQPPTETLASGLLRRLRVLEEALAAAAGVEPVSHAGPPLAAPDLAGDVPSLPVVIWVPHIRSPFNLGNIIRTAAAYGVQGVVIGESAPDLGNPRVRRAAMGGDRMVPIVRGVPELLPAAAGLPVIALETGGTDIDGFAFPEKGILVVGHEELGVPEEALDRAIRDDRVVTIPHFGGKSSLNVGVAAGIALSWWAARRNG
jgi:TrmH family RNA methyltransferase